MSKSKWREIEEAKARFKEFTGHDPKFIDELYQKNMDVGFKFGDCDAILYTTTRDGRVEKYIHKFKKRCRPVLASSHDGKKISLVGGKYKFTDRGIIDD